VQTDLNDIPSHTFLYTLVACICHARLSLARPCSIFLLTNNIACCNNYTYLLGAISMHAGLVVISLIRLATPCTTVRRCA
jgi:hypothetical protein